MEEELRQFEALLETEGRAKETIRHAISHVRALLQTVNDFSLLTTEMLVDYLASRECAQPTKNQMIGSLRKFFRWLGRTDLSFPKEKHVKIKEYQPLSREDLAALHSNISHNFYAEKGLRISVILHFLELGLKPKELINLKWEYFKSEHDETFLEMPDGKGFIRKIPVNKALMELLKWYHRFLGGHNDNVLNMSDGKMNHIFARLKKFDILNGRQIYRKSFRSISKK